MSDAADACAGSALAGRLVRRTARVRRGDLGRAETRQPDDRRRTGSGCRDGDAVDPSRSRPRTAAERLPLRRCSQLPAERPALAPSSGSCSVSPLPNTVFNRVIGSGREICSLDGQLQAQARPGALHCSALLPLAAACWASARSSSAASRARWMRGSKRGSARQSSPTRTSGAQSRSRPRHSPVTRRFQTALAARERAVLARYLERRARTPDRGVRSPARRSPAARGRDVGRARRRRESVGHDHRLGPARPRPRQAPAPRDPDWTSPTSSSPSSAVASTHRRTATSRAACQSGRATSRRFRSDGSDYRVVGVELVPRPPIFLAAITPSSAIAAEQQSERTRLVAGLLASLLLIGLVAYIAGRSIVGSLGELAAAANSIAAGRLDERVQVQRPRRVRGGSGAPSTRWRSSSSSGWRTSRTSGSACARRTTGSATRSPRRSIPSSCCS